jgi:hypothetical protein
MKFFIIFIPVLYLFAAGNQEDLTGISGKYKTEIFMQPAPGDSLMDLSSIGAFMQLELQDDSTFSLLLFIPDNKQFNTERIELSFKGEFYLAEDTVKFTNSGFTLLENKVWTYNNGKIELKEKIRGKNLEIVFSRIRND